MHSDMRDRSVKEAGMKCMERGLGKLLVPDSLRFDSLDIFELGIEKVCVIRRWDRYCAELKRSGPILHVYCM
jgi:hypothetical protein